MGFAGALCQHVVPVILGVLMKRNQTLANHGVAFSSMIDRMLLLVALLAPDWGVAAVLGRSCVACPADHDATEAAGCRHPDPGRVSMS